MRPRCPLRPGRAFDCRNQEGNSLLRRSERDGKSPHGQAFESAAGVAGTGEFGLAWRLPDRAQPGARLAIWQPGHGVLLPECALPHRTRSEKNCCRPHLQKPRLPASPGRFHWREREMDSASRPFFVHPANVFSKKAESRVLADALVFRRFFCWNNEGDAGHARAGRSSGPTSSWRSNNDPLPAFRSRHVHNRLEV
jgi:hypothetical protein